MEIRAPSRRNLMVEQQASDYAPVVPIAMNDERDRSDGKYTLATVPTTNDLSFDSYASPERAKFSSPRGKKAKSTENLLIANASP